MSFVDLDGLTTERRNPNTMQLDVMTPAEIVAAMHEEDLHVYDAIGEMLPTIVRAIELTTRKLQKGGRLIYAGAGTSGRLGVLDAVECVPTFSAHNVQAVIAGGDSALFQAVEGAEDSEELAASDLAAIEVGDQDVVVALAASGRTPYAIGALKYGTQVHASTISVACNKNAAISAYAEIAIEVDSGPEVLTGSTRLKAGTSQKIILNMISTASMVGLGKTYQNLMVDMHASNDKLKERARTIVMEATGANRATALAALEATDYQSKEAIVTILAGVSPTEARKRINAHQGHVRACLTA